MEVGQIEEPVLRVTPVSTPQIANALPVCA